MKKIGVLLVIWIVLAVNLKAQLSTDLVSYQTNKPNPECYQHFDWKYIKSFYTDTRDFVLSPIEWKTANWLTFGGFLLVNAALYTQDEAINNFFVKNQSVPASTVADVFRPFGDPAYMLPAMGIVFFTGHYLGDNLIMSTALVTFKSAVITSAYTALLKYGTHRMRPDSGISSNSWKGPGFSNNDLSFCSGHTSLAFSIASSLAFQFRDTKWVAPVAYSIAALTGISRMYNEKHWATDVFTGAALGIGVTQTIFRNCSNSSDSRFSFYPAPVGKYPGFYASLRL